MKNTLLFSNVVGNIYDKDNCLSCTFNDFMKMLLPKMVDSGTNLVFINAPGFRNDDKYLDCILACFKDCGIKFSNVLDVEENTTIQELNDFPNQHRVYFLMGGNPITQRKIIKKLGLEQQLKTTTDLVIGFCAGAINLSKHSIISSDSDFEKPFCYEGINRVDIVVEPHYFQDESEFTKNRIVELNNFSHKLHSVIYAIPDKSCLFIQDDLVIEYGKIYKFLME